jgi:hypothetical protein
MTSPGKYSSSTKFNVRKGMAVFVSYVKTMEEKLKVNMEKGDWKKR